MCYIKFRSINFYLIINILLLNVLLNFTRKRKVNLKKFKKKFVIQRVTLTIGSGYSRSIRL